MLWRERSGFKTNPDPPCTCLSQRNYGTAGNIQGGANFVKSQRKPSELIFVVLNLVTATQSMGVVLRQRQMDDVINAQS